ncbi:hypothetical protein MOBT1_002139 [Malassezia obtusa]|uniref:Uncharacterized protein n=1 Tax=Malassezia obtusa TaxID=76774 RepID=A0AAF0E1F8_9BASI|nr:hypothetical protein MOBT1_002139 [Malassezia obtusa]
MERGRPSPAPVEAPEKRRPHSVLARSMTAASTAPRTRATPGVRPGVARAHTTPTEAASPPSLRASTSARAHTPSPAAGAHVRPTPTSGKRAFQGTVRVAGAARTATPADTQSPHAVSLGTGARVVGTTPPTTRPHSVAARTRPVRTTSPDRATPSSAEASHSDRLHRARRSPTSPTSEVRTAAPPAARARGRVAKPCAYALRGGAPDESRAARAADASTPRGDVSSSMYSSPAGSALGTPVGARAHPFTPHVPMRSTPLSSTPPVETYDAKHERKLLDLEISNKSLLAINASLESAKVQQAKELRALRQQMFHAQLERAVEPSEVYGLEADVMAPAFAALGEAGSSQNSLPARVARALAQQDEELHELHQRCRHAIDAMLDEARAAILARPDADAGKSRVLHVSELGQDDSEQSDASASASTSSAGASASSSDAGAGAERGDPPRAARGEPHAAVHAPRLASWRPGLPVAAAHHAPGPEAADLSVD